eukprot:3291500-Amphidinium_carterae.1
MERRKLHRRHVDVAQYSKPSFWAWARTARLSSNTDVHVQNEGASAQIGCLGKNLRRSRRNVITNLAGRSEPMSDLTVALPTTSANSPTLDSVRDKAAYTAGHSW